MPTRFFYVFCNMNYLWLILSKDILSIHLIFQIVQNNGGFRWKLRVNPNYIKLLSG